MPKSQEWKASLNSPTHIRDELEQNGVDYAQYKDLTHQGGVALLSSPQKGKETKFIGKETDIFFKERFRTYLVIKRLAPSKTINVLSIELKDLETKKRYRPAIDGRCVDASSERCLLFLSTLLQTTTGKL